MELSREWNIPSRGGKQNKLRLVLGNLTKVQGPCDMVICSAFKHDYVPVSSSLIGALYDKGYDVGALAGDPEPGFVFPDGWISRDTGKDYKRIGCLELLDYTKDAPGSEEALDLILKKSFSTLRYMLERASYDRIPMKTLAMTIPGTGNQGIRRCFILVPLIAHCRYLLEEGIVEDISIYTMDVRTMEETIPAFDRAFGEKRLCPDVFISYSSRQQDLACEIRQCITDSGIECWMAPESIPEGSSYQEMIPDAISSVKILLLILTPDATQSRWVQKEVGSAIGANKVILPYQMMTFDLGKQFLFLLDGEQIMQHKEQAGEGNGAEPYQKLIGRIREILDT